MFNQPPAKRRKRFDLFRAAPVQLVCLSFIAVILVGTVLLMSPISSRAGTLTSFNDALFTATSATCVTGLIVADTYLHWSGFGQFVILLLIQVGGLGLITLTSLVNIMIGKKLGLRSMDLAKESMNTDSFADIKRMVRTIMVVTLSIEALGAAILAITFVPKYGAFEGGFTAVFLSVSSFCNAGFDLLGREGAYSSLMHYTDQPIVYLPIAALIVFGGLGFIVWRELFHYRNTKTLSLHTRLVLVMTGGLILLGTIAFLVFEWNNPNTMGDMSFFDKLGAGLFQSITTRTAGYNTIDQAGLTDMSKLVAIVLMFIGASPASTGGGIKVTTIAVIVMTIVSVMRGYDDTVIMKSRVEKKAVYKAMSLFFLALLLVITCSLLIHFMTDTTANTIDVVFEEVSAFGTVGLSTGLTAELGVLSRYLLILSMYLGRVGPLSLVISLAMRSVGSKAVLPQGKILIG